MGYNRYTAEDFDAYEGEGTYEEPEFLIIEGSNGTLYYVGSGEVLAF